MSINLFVFSIVKSGTFGVLRQELQLRKMAETASKVTQVMNELSVGLVSDS